MENLRCLHSAVTLHKKVFIEVLGKLLREKLPPSPNSNANPKPKPNPDPDRGAIFLGAIFWTLLIKDYKSLMFKRLIYKRFPLRILQ